MQQAFRQVFVVGVHYGMGASPSECAGDATCNRLFEHSEAHIACGSRLIRQGESQLRNAQMSRRNVESDCYRAFARGGGELQWSVDRRDWAGSPEFHPHRVGLVSPKFRSWFRLQGLNGVFGVNVTPGAAGAI